MVPFSKPHIPETEVVRLWQERINRQRQMQDAEGNSLEVVYPGRFNDGRGGDFRDAVISAGNERYTGCIEVHTLSSGWQAHGHHLDPAYNQVVLHVALESSPSGQSEAVRQNGTAVPTVLLSRLPAPVKGQGPAESGLPCRVTLHNRCTSEVLEYLEYTGQQRFIAKASRYEIELGLSEPGQVLYCGITEALGYSKNQEPFRMLAGLASLLAIDKLIQYGLECDCPIRLPAYLLAQAGLLPSQRSRTCADDYTSEIEKSAAGVNVDSRLSASAWELFKVRPVNYPVRRIIALSYLLRRFRSIGWLKGILDNVRQAPSLQPHLALESFLLVPAEGYWSGHYDFDREIRGSSSSPFLLGHERAAEIVINVILPFAWVWGHLNGEPGLAEKAEQIAAGYPKLGSNSIERHMLQQLCLSSREINSARRQQGLLYIYKTLCTQGKCNECALAK